MPVSAPSSTAKNPRQNLILLQAPVLELLLRALRPLLTTCILRHASIRSNVPPCPALPRDGPPGFALRACKGEVGKWHPRPTQKLHSSSAKENAEGANVDKIRDILFGSQMRDYEKRFVRLEETVTKAIETLREDMTKRLDTLSNYIKEETDSLGQRVKTEKSERAEGLKELTREMKDTRKDRREKALATRRPDVRRPRGTARQAA